MKKLIVVMAMLSAFISAPVLAESIDSAGVNRDTQYFEISGSLGEDCANKKVSVIVLNKDVQPDALITVTNENIKSTIYAIYDTYANSKGEYEIARKFSASSGVYCALVNPATQGGDVTFQYFKHFDINEVSKLIESLENARKEKDYSEIKNILTDFNREMLGLPDKLYCGLEYSDFDDNAFRSIANSTNEFKSANIFAEEYEKAGVVNAFNKLSDGKLNDTITECDKYLNLQNTDIYKLYANMQAAAKTSVENYFDGKTDFTSTEQIINSFNEKVLLKTNEQFENWTLFNDFIEKYYTYFDIDLAKYHKLSSLKSNVDKAMTAKTFETAEAFKAAFDTAVANANSESGSGGGSGSGGSGSKSNGSKVKIDSDVIVPNVTPSTKTLFGDVGTDHWAFEPVNYLANKGIIAGRGNGVFEPDAPVSRKEAVKIIVLSLGIADGDAKIGLGDVSSNDWAYSYICSAVSAGVVNGDENGNFKPDANITRQDLAVMIYRAAKISGTELEQGLNTSAFADSDSISDYAQDAVSALSGAKVINGYENGNFAPHDNCTRAQLAKMIYGIIKK